MARPGEFVDPDYDRRLAEFKARRAEMRKEAGVEKKQEPAKDRAQVARRY